MKNEKINLLGMNAKQLVSVHNDHAADAGAKPIGKWAGKVEVLRQRTQAVVEAATAARAVKAKQGTKSTKKPRGLGIGKRVVELLHGGTTDTNNILAIVRGEIPEANITDKCVRWYASKEKVKLTTARRPKAA
jgi:hypothetical protein